MKKIKPRHKKRLVRRSQKGFKKKYSRIGPRRHVVEAWFGGRFERLLCTGTPTIPPTIMCLNRNPEQTLSLLSEMRSWLAVGREPRPDYRWVSEPRSARGLRRISGYADFSVIEEISAETALIIASEYDSARRLVGGVPPIINHQDWKPGIFDKLYELGFFGIVGLETAAQDRYRDYGDIRMMRFVTGSNTAKLEQTSKEIVVLSDFIEGGRAIKDEVIFALNSALSEGMVNVAKHAYPDDMFEANNHVNAWWVTASADRSNHRLTVVLYDRGATIPVTLPRKSFWERIRAELRIPSLVDKGFEYQHDASYIEGAVRLGETQTGDQWRGEGLQQMKDLVDIAGTGSLTIWSRGGVCRFRPGESPHLENHRHSVGGTLIEWTIEFPE